MIAGRSWYVGTHSSAVNDRIALVLRRFGPGVDVLHQAAHHFAVGNCRRRHEAAKSGPVERLTNVYLHGLVDNAAECLETSDMALFSGGRRFFHR